MMWQISAAFFMMPNLLFIMEFFFKVLCHLVLAVMAFSWGCSRAEPKMAATAAGAGHNGSGDEAGVAAWGKHPGSGFSYPMLPQELGFFCGRVSVLQMLLLGGMPLSIGIYSLSRGTTLSLQQ